MLDNCPSIVVKDFIRMFNATDQRIPGISLTMPIPGTGKSMEKPLKKHGKISWIPLKTMEHGARAKFHGFHGQISILSMLAWNRKIVKMFPMKAWKAWNLKPWKASEAWEFIKMKAWKYGKHGKYITFNNI